MVPLLSALFIMEPLSLPNQREPYKVQQSPPFPYNFPKYSFHQFDQNHGFHQLLKSIVSIFLLVSINQRLVPCLISLGCMYKMIYIWGGGSDPRHRDFTLAHHSSHCVTSSLRFEVISALRARLSLIFAMLNREKLAFA